MSNLDEKRDAQFRHYRERQHPGKECPMCSDLYHGWNAAWNAALEALREVTPEIRSGFVSTAPLPPGNITYSGPMGPMPEFDVAPIERAFHFLAQDPPHKHFTHKDWAAWGAQEQFSRDKERIALAEARIAELESALADAVTVCTAIRDMAPKPEERTSVDPQNERYTMACMAEVFLEKYRPSMETIDKVRCAKCGVLLRAEWKEIEGE